MRLKVSEARTQIYCSKKELAEARLAAKKAGVSLAAYIREAVREHIRYGCRETPYLTKDSPLNRLVGLAKDRGDAAPVAREHDKYLTNEPLRWRKK